MAKAGFWSIGGYRISFRKDGRWYADEEAITNPRIARLFSRHIEADGNGGWVVDLGVDRQTVIVEDTALVIVAVDGNRRDGFEVTANDGVRSELDCGSLEIGQDEVLYCTLDRGERGGIRARFLRPAYYQLATAVEEEGGVPSIRVRGRSHPIRRVEG